MPNNDSTRNQNIDLSADDSPGRAQAVNAVRGAVQGDHLIHTPGTQQKERPRNEKILLKAVRAEVCDRLAQSLHQAVLTNLSKESQADRVERPWDMEVKVGDRPRRPLPQDKTVVDVFDDEAIGGKLLILGQPGAGKTTTLLSLAEVLQARAEKAVGAPMPVLLSLSTWKDDQQAISVWLVEQLKSKYSVRSKLGRDWLAQKKLLPLLDGLDELASERQERCVQRVNEWLGSGECPGALVVCSRIEESGHYQTGLALNGTVCLQPLSDSQIDDYLQHVGKPDLRAAVAQDAELRELVRVPLHLSMAVLVYDEAFGRRWQEQDTADARLGLLLETYVARMLGRELSNSVYPGKRQPTEEQTKIRLIRLARQLKTESKDGFLIEQMQPALLATARQKWAYQLILGLIVGLIVGWAQVMIFGLLQVPIFGLIVVLIFGPIFVLIFVLIFGLTGRLERIEAVESFDLSFARKDFFSALTQGLIFGLIGGLIVARAQGLIVGLAQGLIAGLAFGLTFGLIRGLKQEDISIRVKPNQGILQARNHALILVGVAIAISLLLSLLSQWLEVFLFANILVSTLGLSLIPHVFLTGGKVCIQHLALRLVLWGTGQIPWNYARFLNHCTDRLLLQRVGGGYRFIHKRLQDHFAELP